MVRRVVVVFVAGVGLTVGASLDVAPQSSAQPVTLAGFVSMATSADGRDTVVSIDVDTIGRAADGLVEHAFRLQHAPGPRYDYVGPASVTYDRHHVVVGVTDDSGWTFTVAGRPPLLMSRRLPYISLDVQGLSHHWGVAVQRPHDEVTASLMVGGCGSTDTGPCSDCQAGGSGAEGCTIGCGGGGDCSADCTDGYFACCNCPGLCRCCPPREGGQATGGSARIPAR